MVYEGVVWFELVAHQVFIGPTLRHPARLIGSVNLFCGARRVHWPLGAKGRLLELSRFCPPGSEPRFLRLHRPCPWRLKFWWQRIIPPPWHHASMPMLHGRFPRVCPIVTGFYFQLITVHSFSPNSHHYSLPTI